MMSLFVLVLEGLMLTYSCYGSMEEIVGEMQRELQQLKTKTASYEIEIQDLKMKTATYENEIQHLKTKTATCEKETQDFKTKTATYEKETQDLKTKTATYEKETHDLKTKTATYEKETHDLKTKTAACEKETQDLKTKTATYEKETQDLKTKTATYEKETQDLKTKTAAYEKETQQLKSENRFLWDEMKVLKTSVSSCESSTKSSINEILAFKQQLNDLKDKRGNGTSGPKRRFVLGANVYAEKPAFSASLTNHATGLGNSQTIVFDNVFTNDLSGYSGVTGVFTAPMNGTYFFTATVMSHEGQYLETNICLNGKSLVYMYSYDTHYEQGTNSIVLVLRTGDKVWVRHNGNEGTKAYGGHWSTFTGFML